MTRLLIRLFCYVAVLLGGAGTAYACKYESGNRPNPALCSDEKVCFFATTDHGSNRFTWTFGSWSDFVREAKKRGLSCGVKSTPLSLLGKQFVALSKEEKKKIQSILATKEYYKSTIDGLYGKNTDAALKAFNKEFLNDSDLKKAESVEALFQALLSEKPNDQDNRCLDNNTKSAKCRPVLIVPRDEEALQVEPETVELVEPEQPPLTIDQVKASYDASDFSKAFEDAQTLAVQGNAEAQLYLGKMYADGRGTLQVTTSAHMWFNIASMNGNDEAFEERKAITAKMTPELINEAQKMAVACIKSDYRECGIQVKPAEQKITGKKVLATASNIKLHFSDQSLLRRKQLQYALKDMGLYASSIDGVYGNRTEQAFMNFQNIQDAEDQSAEELFQLVLSKVDVPTSFAAPQRQKVIVKKEEPSKPKYVAAMGYSPYGNTTMPVQQAIDVCKSGADKAFDNASDNARYKSNSYSGRCNRYGSYSNCTVQEDSPYGSDMGTALAIGMMEGISRGLAGRAAREKEMKSCMAHYGWRKN